MAFEKHEWQYARVGFRIAPQVLAHTRKYCPQARKNEARIRLKDWKRLSPALPELGARQR
jgi:hypothetical protein